MVPFILLSLTHQTDTDKIIPIQRKRKMNQKYPDQVLTGRGLLIL